MDPESCGCVLFSDGRLYQPASCSMCAGSMRVYGLSHCSFLTTERELTSTRLGTAIDVAGQGCSGLHAHIDSRLEYKVLRQEVPRASRLMAASRKAVIPRRATQTWCPRGRKWISIPLGCIVLCFHG